VFFHFNTVNFPSGFGSPGLWPFKIPAPLHLKELKKVAVGCQDQMSTRVSGFQHCLASGAKAYHALIKDWVG